MTYSASDLPFHSSLHLIRENLLHRVRTCSVLLNRDTTCSGNLSHLAANWISRPKPRCLPREPRPKLRACENPHRPRKLINGRRVHPTTPQKSNTESMLIYRRRARRRGLSDIPRRTRWSIISETTSALSAVPTGKLAAGRGTGYRRPWVWGSANYSGETSPKFMRRSRSSIIKTEKTWTELSDWRR